MELNDAACVAQVQAGDREAYRLLVERHSHSVFKLAYRMTHSEHDAEEVVQETFLRAWRRIGDFQSRANFRTWLYRIAVNCSLDVLQRRKSRAEMSLTEDPERDTPAIEPVTADPSPERQALSGEIRERIAAAMEQLTPVERTAFVLRHFEGQSIEEISATLAVRSNAAKNTIFRAVQKMRRALGPVAGVA